MTESATDALLFVEYPLSDRRSSSRGEGVEKRSRGEGVD